MMCHLDRTSCSRYNTAAHFGMDAESAMAVQKRILELTRGPWRRRRRRRQVTKKNVTWNVWEDGDEKYERHSETSSCLCNPSTGVLCLHKQRCSRPGPSLLLPRAFPPRLRVFPAPRATL